MTPTLKQRALLSQLAMFLESLRVSNDLNSPTIQSDLSDFIDRLKEDYTIPDKEGTDLFRAAWNIVKVTRSL